MFFQRKKDDPQEKKEERVIHPGDKVSMSAGAQKTAPDVYQSIMMEKQVGELVNKKSLLIVLPSDSVEKIVQLLQKEKQSAVLVVQHEQLLGIVSKRDLLRRTAGMETKLSGLKALEVMTANPEIVKAADPLAFAVSKMA
ncbi:MAG TPA: hypothetical protein DIS66_00290, partial [Candidatus Omnitrophica bacterium]|nr:hypothetical protein [Candidatus Omnitrophota bacterium]